MLGQIGQIIVAVGFINATVMAAIAWMLKSVISQAMTKDLERFREQLKVETLRFSKLHETRGTVIAELYSNLRDLTEANEQYVNPAEIGGQPTKPELRKVLREALVKFTNHYERSRIYFSEPLCTKIDGFLKDMMDPTLKFSMYEAYPDLTQGGNAMSKTDAWIKAWEHAREKVPAARLQIEQEFRKIFGVAD